MAHRQISSYLLIGLHGKAHSGKDTACDFIMNWASHTGRVARRDAFADRLKISAAHALGFNDGGEVALCNTLKEGGEVIIRLPDTLHGGFINHTVSGREYLQYYGTEAHREVFDTDFWVNAVLPDPKDPFCGVEPFDVMVVTDVRFPNEAERIRGCGGEVWQIDRPSVEIGDAHASEQPLPKELINRVVVNNQDLEYFEDRVLSAVEEKLYYA